VTVHGRGGHASQPHRAADPIPAACEMVIALQTMVTRKFDVFDPVVITVGSFHAGTTDNVIPDQATFLATARSYSAASRAALAEAVPRLITDIADAHGLTADAEYAAEYPVTVNDVTAAAFAGQVITEVFGPDRGDAARIPITGAEDFSFVLAALGEHLTNAEIATRLFISVRTVESRIFASAAAANACGRDSPGRCVGMGGLRGAGRSGVRGAAREPGGGLGGVSAETSGRD